MIVALLILILIALVFPGLLRLIFGGIALIALLSYLGIEPPSTSHRAEASSSQPAGCEVVPNANAKLSDPVECKTKTASEDGEAHNPPSGASLGTANGSPESNIKLGPYFGTCSRLSVPRNFPALYSQCGYILYVGDMTTIIMTKAGAEISTTGEDVGRITANGSDIETGQITFQRDEAFDGDWSKSISNGIVTEVINRLTINLPYPSLNFAREKLGARYEGTFMTKGICSWNDPPVPGGAVSCSVTSPAGPFSFQFLVDKVYPAERWGFSRNR